MRKNRKRRAARKKSLVAGEKIRTNLRGQYRQVAARADEEIQPAIRLVAEGAGERVGFTPIHGLLLIFDYIQFAAIA